MMIRPCILLGVLSRITTAQYITPSTASEVVFLPDPTTPIIPTVRTNCPHLQTGLSDWHESSTWGGGSIPTSGSVTIPTATRVLLSQTLSGPVGVLTIPADSELIVGEGVAMDLEGMDVQGKLTIGSETCLVEDQVTLTLHGSRPTDIDTNPKPEHFKGISVNGGTLNLHGKRYFPTWSRLAATVHFNENVLVLQQTVNWVPGQQIVLVTSSIKDSRDYHQNEVAIIDQVISLSGAGSMIHLVDPVQYTHLANSNYQVEVG